MTLRNKWTSLIGKWMKKPGRWTLSRGSFGKLDATRKSYQSPTPTQSVPLLHKVAVFPHSVYLFQTATPLYRITPADVLARFLGHTPSPRGSPCILTVDMPLEPAPLTVPDADPEMSPASKSNFFDLIRFDSTPPASPETWGTKIDHMSLMRSQPSSLSLHLVRIPH